MNYDAFISYSHADCGNIAPAIQRALENIGKPWYRLKRNLNVFRDETNLTASPKLWNSIISALDNSENLIILASPIAQKSYWVNKEIEHWFSKVRTGKLYIVLSEGEINWYYDINDFDWEKTNCLPETLSKKFKEEPLWIDLTSYVHSENKTINYKQAGFTSSLTKVIGGIVSKPPREIESDELRRKRKTTLALFISSFAFISLTAIGILLYYQSNLNERHSIANNLIAKGNYIKNDDINKALLYYAYAYEKNNDTATLNILKEFYFENSLIDSHNHLIDSLNLFYSTTNVDESKIVDSNNNADITTAVSCNIFGNSLSFFKENNTLLTSVYFNQEGNNIVNNQPRLTVEKFLISSNKNYAFVTVGYVQRKQSLIVDIKNSKIISYFTEEGSGKYETGFKLNPTTVYFDISNRYYLVGYENGSFQMTFFNQYDSLYNVYNFVDLNSQDNYTSSVSAICSNNNLIFIGYEDGAFAIYRNEESRYSDNANGNFLYPIKRIRLIKCSEESDCSIKNIHFEPKIKTIFIESFSENVYKMKLNKSLRFQQLSVEKVINELSIEDLTKEKKKY